ncbi:MAG: peptide ABC transporter substrate-binding protein, partial [Butyrivibrio sp.]|nr:peptide ABC transporter substrate-binding protein [Butyrivibrio sp.]
MRNKYLFCIVTLFVTQCLAAGCGKNTLQSETQSEQVTAAEDAAEEKTESSEQTWPATLTNSVHNSAAPDWTEYNQLIFNIKNTTDYNERETMMHRAEDILMSTGAVVPLYYYNDPYLQKESVDGIYSSLFGTKYFMYAK